MDIKAAMDILGKKFEFSAVDTHRVIKGLDLPPTAVILDVGTGRGSLAITLAINGYHVFTGEPGDDATVYANQGWFENAQKVNVDHLIEFKPFKAENIPYADGFFDAVFSLGTLHHVDEINRKKVMQEFVRTTKANAVICFFEPNQQAINMIRQTDVPHPDAADPNRYVQGLDLTAQTIFGSHFDAFVFKKCQ